MPLYRHVAQIPKVVHTPAMRMTDAIDLTTALRLTALPTADRVEG